MEKRLTSDLYQAEIRSCAAWLDNEIRVRRKDRATCLRKFTETHPWVLNLGWNLEVLRITMNDSAYFSVYGPMLALSFADAIYKMTLLAFEADVGEALSQLEREHAHDSDALPCSDT